MINNEGELAFGYDLEDTDTYNNGVVFNGQESVLWNNVRDAFPNEIKDMYVALRGGIYFNYPYIYEAFERHQSVWSEAVWNEDAFIKYLQPYLLQGTDNLAMLQGSKSSQRDWWLFNGFKYRDSKYQAGDANNYIQLRAFTKDDITITPYSSIYAKVEFGNERIDIQRCLKGESVTLSDPSTDPWAAGTDTVVRIYSADRLSSIGDLSGLNAGTADFSSATKLEQLKLGDGATGYTNTHLTSLTVGNNDLLTTLDIRNCVNLTQTVDLSGCHSLEEVKAGGSSITGVQVSDGGHLKTMTLPNTITNLTVKNQKSFEELNAEYDSLSTLWIENTPNIPIGDIINEASNLSRVRLIGVEWDEESATSLGNTIDILKSCIGLDANGNNVAHAIVTGVVNVPSINADLLEDISENFPELIVKVDGVSQLIMTYVNWDGAVIYRDTIPEGSNAINPVSLELIDTPTKQGTADTHYTFSGFGTLPTNVKTNKTITAQYTPSYRVQYKNYDNTILHSIFVTSGGTATYNGVTPVKPQTAQYTYTFSGWSGSQTNITEPIDLIATFTYVVRTYYVQFKNGDTILQTITAVPYGTSATYTGSTPIKPGEVDDTNFEFMGWNPSPNNITGDTICYAQYRDKRSNTVRFLQGTLEDYVSTELERVNQYSFYNTSSLKTFTAPVTSIGDNAFAYCSNLNTVDLTSTSSVTIADSAFLSCSKLTHLIIRSNSVCTLPSSTTINSSMIHKGLGAIYVPQYLVSSYKVAINWSQYADRIHPISDYPFTDFNTGTITDSWETIVENCNNGNTSQYNVGDTRTVFVNGEYVLMQLVGKDVDTLADGSGNKAATTWIAKQTLEESRAMSNGDYDNWDNCSMRTWLRSTLFNSLPETLQDNIKEVDKTYLAYTVESSTSVSVRTKTCADTIWIPSMYECKYPGSNYSDIESYGVTYMGVYTTYGSLSKTRNNSTNSVNWWTRTRKSHSGYWKTILNNGMPSDTYRTQSLYVTIGFCI